MEKFKKTIILCALHFKKINMSLLDFYKIKLKEVTPLDLKQWQLLRMAIKEGELYIASEILSENRLLVYLEDKVVIDLTVSSVRPFYTLSLREINTSLLICLLAQGQRLMQKTP